MFSHIYQVSLLVAFSVVANIVFAAQWYEAYEKALQAMEKEQWQNAVTYLNQAIAERPQPRANTKTYGMRFIDYLPYLYRGIAYHQLGDDTRALQDLQKSQDFGEARKARRDKRAFRKLQSTLSRVKQNLQNGSQPDVQAIFAEGVSRFHAADYEGAGKKFIAVLKIQPNHPQARRYLDEIDRQLSKPPAATATKSKADRNKAGSEIHVDSRQPTGTRADNGPDKTFTQGLHFFELGDFKNAKKRFKQVRKTGPVYAQAAEYLKIISEVEKQVRDGIVAFFDGDYEVAISRLSKASSRYRSNPKIHAFLGCAYAAKYLLSGEEDQASLQMALDSFSKAKTLDAEYQLSRRYFSPRIIALFKKASSL